MQDGHSQKIVARICTACHEVQQWEEQDSSSVYLTVVKTFVSKAMKTIRRRTLFDSAVMPNLEDRQRPKSMEEVMMVSAIAGRMKDRPAFQPRA